MLYQIRLELDKTATLWKIDDKGNEVKIATFISMTAYADFWSWTVKPKNA